MNRSSNSLLRPVILNMLSGFSVLLLLPSDSPKSLVLMIVFSPFELVRMTLGPNIYSIRSVSL